MLAFKSDRDVQIGVVSRTPPPPRTVYRVGVIESGAKLLFHPSIPMLVMFESSRASEGAREHEEQAQGQSGAAKLPSGAEVRTPKRRATRLSRTIHKALRFVGGHRGQGHILQVLYLIRRER